MAAGGGAAESRVVWFSGRRGNSFQIRSAALGCGPPGLCPLQEKQAAQGPRGQSLVASGFLQRSAGPHSRYARPLRSGCPSWEGHLPSMSRWHALSRVGPGLIRKPHSLALGPALTGVHTGQPAGQNGGPSPGGSCSLGPRPPGWTGWSSAFLPQNHPPRSHR